MKAEELAATRLFAYGTLMFPQVFVAVCGTSRPTHPAWLADHACYRVRRAVYPGLLPQAGALTSGVLVSGLDAADWLRLDAFEGSFYERRAVRITLAGNGTAAAWAYVVRPEHRAALSAEPWLAEAFGQRHLATYLAAFA